MVKRGIKNKSAGLRTKIVIVAAIVVLVAAILFNISKDPDFSPKKTIEAKSYESFLPESSGEGCNVPDLRFAVLRFLIEEGCQQAEDSCEEYLKCISDDSKDCSDEKKDLCSEENQCLKNIGDFKQLVDTYSSVCHWTNIPDYSFEGCKSGSGNLCN